MVNSYVAAAVSARGYSFRNKFQAALIDIRWQDGNAHPSAFADENRNFFRVIDFVAQQTRHEFHRVMRLEIRGLITDHAVGRTVALVESVTCEFFQQIENGVRFFLRNLVCACAAFDEILSLFRHLLLVFLAHGAPEKIGLRE